jgi:predicted esterase
VSASPLLRRVEPAAGAARGVVLALHREGADASECVARARAAARHCAVWAAQAPRARNPVLGSGHAPAGWDAYRGYAWYREDGGRAEPASFGDALAALDLLVDEIREAHPGLPIVAIGAGQGAALALALADARADAIRGALALDRHDAAFVPDWIARAIPPRQGAAPWEPPRTSA